MTARTTRGRIYRAAAHLLVYLQAWVGIPVNALSAKPPGEPSTARSDGAGHAEAHPSAGPMPSPSVSVNRQRPMVAAPSTTPEFSGAPTDLEIFRARVFDEPLVPIGAGTTADENAALAEALATYAKVADPERVEPLRYFLAEHPGSPWRAALLTDLGLVYRRTGYFSHALDALEEAWALAKGEAEPRAKAIADRALSQLAELNGRLGRYERLDRLFAEIEGRDVGGSAGEWLLVVKQGRWMMEHEPGISFRCGPYALERIQAFLRGSEELDPRLVAARSTRQGTSLLQLSQLANEVGLGLQPAKRSPGAHLPLPALVHWGVGHFAALLEERDGRYRAQDPTFSGEFWVSRAALDAETSGYFLVPGGALPEGWLPAEAGETASVWGKGFVTNLEPPTPEEPERCPCRGSSCPPMAVYGFKLLNVGLRVYDTPVRYSPPRGPSVSFEVDYNQRDVFQPQTFSYSNLGPKWTFEWLSYVEDDPDTLAADVKLYARGGGQATYTGMGGGTSQPNSRNQSVLARTASSPIRYERRLPDGSLEVFTAASGVSPRKVFMTSWSDPQGNTLTLTYDGSMRVVALTDALNQVTTLSYESADPLKITRVTDPFGRPARFEYDASGRLARITDAIGITSAFTYDSADFITSLTTPYGTSRFATGGAGIARWLEATDPLGGKERVEFAQLPPGIPWEEPPDQVPTGMPVVNNYLVYRNTFFWDKRAMAFYPGDYTKAHIYHWLHGRAGAGMGVAVLESEKRPLENRVWYSYPGQSNPTVEGTVATRIATGRVLDPDGPGPLSGETQIDRYEYNSKGLKTRVTDPLGRETVYEYDTNEIDLLRVKRKNGASYNLLQTLTYNSQHRPLSRSDASGQTTTYTYNSQGQIATVTTPPRAGIPENRTTTYTYDTNSYLQSISGPAVDQTSSFTYDGYGRLRTATDAEGHTTTYDYDALGRVTKVTYPDGTYEETVYNRLDPEKRRDRLGRWAQTFYDALQRVVATRDALGRTTTRQWCTCGSLDKLIDANGNAITWERDIQGRVTREIRADGSDLDFVYENTTNRLKQVTDPKNQAVVYEYFADNNLKQTTYTNAQNPTANVSFTYDPSYNRPVTMVDGTGTTSYSYHPVTTPPTLGAGRLASVNGPLANDTMTYTYDELGRRTRRLINGVATTQTYDTLGRVDSEVTPIGTFIYGYVGVTGRLSGITYPNGQTTAYAYFGNVGDHRLQDIHNQLSGGATLSRFQYTYDADGTIKTWTQQASSGPAQVYELGYDGADQLTGATLRTTGPTPAILKRYAYDYDKAGNRTTEQIDDSAMAATYNNMDRLLSQQPGGALRFAGTVNEPATVTVQGKPAQVTTDNRFTGSASVPSGTSTVEVKATDPSGNLRANTYQVSLGGASKSLSYDANGNLVGDGSRGFEWDAEDRLVAATLGAHRSEFTYDGKGRRVRIVEKDNGVVTGDRWLLWCDESICEERDAGGGTVRKRFFERGVQEDGVSYYYAKDHLGSVREMTDASGTICARYDYDPYGRVTKTTGTNDTPFRFTGHYYHSPSSLTLTFYRAYDSGMGRWISQDPTGPVDGTNLYAYVQNDPVNYLDPLGLFKLEDKIRQVRTLGIGQVCPGTAGGACTVGASVVYLCTCTDTGCDNPESKVDLSILRLYGTMYIYSAPWPTLKKQPKDKTVTDADSAIAHEYNVHINPAVAAVTPLIEAFEEKTFQSKGECEAGCHETQAKVRKLYAETLRETQKKENEGK